MLTPGARCTLALALALVHLLLAGGLASATPLPRPVPLPRPQTDGGRPLMQVLKERKSSRSFRPDPLPPQTLSNLLWAAFGVNRPDGKRTAPSAMNRQEIDIYVVLASGAYRYEPTPHTLAPVASGDLRARTGRQPFVKEAPLGLIYVADLSRATPGNAADRALYTAADAGFIAQNVYLYCASAGLGTVVRGSIDRPALAAALGLRADQQIVLAQTVGLPAR